MNDSKGNLGIAVAIIIAGLIIAGAVIFTENGTKNAPTGDVPTEALPEGVTVRPVDDTDHILGDINAPIKIVEYSDTECPFCKRLHETLNEVLRKYDGKVAWVYRHMPLQQLHSKAITEASAAECVAELGGEEKFWTYLNKIYEVTPANNGLDLSLLPTMATEIGIDQTAFTECLDSGRHIAAIEASVAEGAAAGAQGTPYSIIITPDGQKIPVGGAQPINVWEQVIDSILAAAESDTAALEENQN